MKYLLIIICLAGLLSPACSQDSKWTRRIIDENLSISFPGDVAETGIDTTVGEKKRIATSIKFFRCETLHTTLTLIITSAPDGLRVKNERSFEITLKGVAKGTLESFEQQGFACSVEDTAMGAHKGIKFSCGSGKEKGYPRFRAYIFLVRNKVYMLQGLLPDEANAESAISETNDFLRSVKFTPSPLKQYDAESTAESTPEKLGRLVGSLAIVVAIFAVVWGASRKKNR